MTSVVRLHKIAAKIFSYKIFIYRVALRLQSAMHDMHAVSLLHADLKSDNVVLNTADNVAFSRLWSLCRIWPANHELH